MANHTASPGLINNRYEIQKTLWTGGMGTVYQVLDRQSGREMALKLLDGDHPIAPTRLHRFKQEFRRTPDLVPAEAWEVYDLGLTEHGLLYMTLECFPAGAAPVAGGAANAGSSFPRRAEWLEVLATEGMLEGDVLTRVLAWLAGATGAQRALLQVLDDDGQVLDFAALGDAAEVLDASRYLLERVRYERETRSLSELGRTATAVPILAGEQLLGVLFTDRAGSAGALDGGLLQEAAGDLALAFAKDRRVRKAQEDTRHLAMLNALSRMISATMDLPQILKLVLGQALEVSQAEQGAVFWGAERLATLDREGRPVDALRVSQSVVSQVLEEGRSLSILDTQEDARFATQASIMDLQLRSIMCVPLRAGQEARGVLYVSSQSVNRTFGPHDLEVLEAIAAQVALALETAQSYQTIRELNAGLEQKVLERTAELQDAMRELQKTQAQLVQSEKMASLGQMVAGVAHELNNPLNFIHGNLKVLRDYLASIRLLLALYDGQGQETAAVKKAKDDMDYEYLATDLDKIIESCLKGATRSQKIVEDLKLFSGHDEADLKPVDLKAGIESAIAMVQGRFAERVSYALDLADLPLVSAHGKQLNQVFLALLTNAAQAIAGTGTVSVRLAREGEDAVLAIEDSGCGIPADVLPRIFDPFFTTRPVGEGTGLGLTTSFSIVERHNGRLEVASTLGTGTRAVVRLPLAGLGA